MNDDVLAQQQQEGDAIPNAASEVNFVVASLGGSGAAADLARQRQCGARRAVRPRVVDVFMYMDEAEIVELRMHELDGVVDVFVVVEATRTFSGRPRSPLFNASSPAMAPFAGKIRQAFVTDLVEGGDNWVREAEIRCGLVRARVPHARAANDIDALCAGVR